MHISEAQLNDYADGALADDAAAAVRAHLADCADCAREAERLSALRGELAQLPREIAPPRDLRADIWRRIDETRVVDIGSARRGMLWSLRYRLAAAAVVLIVASSALTLLFVRDRHMPGFPTDAARDVRLAADSRSLERQYSEEVRELELVLRKSRGALAPETIRILEENLRVIDAAIREAREALASDPNSGMLVDLLRSAYERKLELLRQAARSSPVT